VFYQQDNGQANQDVKFVSCWDPKLEDTPNGGVWLVLLDLDTEPGKSSEAAAKGARCTGKVLFSQLKKDIHFEDLKKELHACCAQNQLHNIETTADRE
jgi:hypothetical protein